MGNIIQPEVVKQLTPKITSSSQDTPPPPPTKYETWADIHVYQITKPFYTIQNINCSNFSIYTKCPEQDENCEVCTNFAYRDWYEQNNAKRVPMLGIFDDSKAEYNRTWVQTCNLGIGIVLLSIGIYYQQSN